MRIFFRYAHSHWRALALAAAFTAVFLTVFWLYGLPGEPVLYAGAICGILGGVAAIADFIRYRERDRRLRQLEARFEEQYLPAPRDTIEDDYQTLLRAMDRRRMEQENRWISARQELTDYYTLWAHQIKTPIAAMRLQLQMGAEPGEMEEELFRIEQYVEMVLGYLRSESLSGDLMIRRWDLDEVVRGCVRKYRKQFIRRRIGLDYAPLHATVLTDAKWLAFVIEQVLTNALKYTPEGGTIRIRMHALRADALVIEDTGVGIRPEDLPRVFEKGYTGVNGREGDRRATGIGLYLCRRILSRLGHGIEIESAPNRGTRVILSLDSVPLEVE